jgi:hypothetical protein
VLKMLGDSDLDEGALGCIGGMDDNEFAVGDVEDSSKLLS